VQVSEIREESERVRRTFAFFFLGLPASRRNFPADCGTVSDPTHPPMAVSAQQPFTVLSRNDAGFALILSERVWKIGAFSGSAPERSL
jgi:hypothetical protein